jgi:hypothetical protein
VSTVSTIDEPVARITHGRGRAARVPAEALGRTAIVMIVLGLTPAAAQDGARAAAANMGAKIAQIEQTGAHPRPPQARPVTTAFTDEEMNAYLTLDGPTFLPPGIASPHVATGDGGKVTARAIVDLDAVRLSRQRGLLDPLALLRGRLEVVATGFVAGSDGRGTGRLESATVAGVPVPRRVVQELLRYYTRTPDRPEGYGLDTPFELPAGIRSVTVGAGRVTVTQ